jgi:hypothetical protein
MLRRFVSVVPLTLAALGFLGACGGGDAVTPPVKPAPPTLELHTDTALVFTGRPVALAALVTARDAHGNTVALPELAVALPDGWIVRHDSIVPPAYESRGTIVVGLAASGLSGAGPLGDVTGQALDATAAVDLRGRGFVASWRCVAAGGIMNAAGVAVDSVVYDRMAVDSVVYAADSGFVRNFGGVAQMWWSGGKVVHLADGTADTVSESNHVEVTRQAPDSLMFTVETASTGAPAVKVSASPLTYEGATWCSSDYHRRRDPVRLEASVDP